MFCEMFLDNSVFLVGEPASEGVQFEGSGCLSFSETWFELLPQQGFKALSF